MKTKKPALQMRCPTAMTLLVRSPTMLYHDYNANAMALPAVSLCTCTATYADSRIPRCVWLV